MSEKGLRLPVQEFIYAVPSLSDPAFAYRKKSKKFFATSSDTPKKQNITKDIPAVHLALREPQPEKALILQNPLKKTLFWDLVAGAVSVAEIHARRADTVVPLSSQGWVQVCLVAQKNSRRL